MFICNCITWITVCFNSISKPTFLDIDNKPINREFFSPLFKKPKKKVFGYIFHIFNI